MTIQTASRPGLLALALAASLATQAHAQVAPDAGKILQELQPPVATPRERKALTIQAPVASDRVLPGGPLVVVQTVSFAGNTVISQDTLQAALGNVAGKSFDLAGLLGLAARISDLYHARGFPFARAVLPPQDLQQGALRMEIIEGRYGLVQAEGEDAALATQAAHFLSRLVPGAVIESAALERESLLLDAMPGINIAPAIRPGAQAGTGDLVVRVTRAQRVAGHVGLDNAGSRYTGQTRASANLDINSPFMLGDQINIHALASDAHLWLGALGYGLPLGTSGMRGQIGYSHTRYELVKEFANLQANGTAKVASVGVSYPLVRSQKANLTLSGTYQAKDLQDNIDSSSTRESKSSKSLPMVLQYDLRDGVGGGGITYGSLGWTPGHVRLDAALTALDANNTRGSFNKFNLDVVRLQSLPAGFSLMGHLSVQSASKNLDSSEKMGLGGANGVRAYPLGEASGDEGVLAQLELRYNAGLYAPFAFWDGGSIKTNARPAAGAARNERNLSGGGVGVRYQRDGWSAAVSLAWRNKGGAPQSDSGSATQPRAWVNLGYQF